MPEAPTLAEVAQHQEWTTWPAGPWNHSVTAAYDRQKGHALRLFIRLLLNNLPLERVQPGRVHGKVPKTPILMAESSIRSTGPRWQL